MTVDEEVVRQLVDEAFKAGKVMIQTHLKDDILRFIHLARQLDALGYQMIWVKHRGVVGATRKGDNPKTSSQLPQPLQLSPTLPKEVHERADKGINGRSDTIVREN